MISGTVSARLARGLVAFSSRLGASSAELIQAARIEEPDLAEPDGRVPLEVYVRLVACAKAMTGTPALPILWAEAVGMAELSIVGLVMESAATMGEAFQHLQRYSRLVVESEGSSEPPFALSMANGRLFMESRRVLPDGAEDLIEAAFVRLACGPRKFLKQPHVLSVHLASAAPPFASEYERIFQCPVHFDAGRNAMELHPEVAGWPVQSQPPYLLDVLVKHAEGLLSGLENRTTWRRRTEQALISTLHEGSPSAEEVARRLGFSRQTLFRRLRGEDTTYADVLDALRERLAKDYIRDRKHGIAEAAFLLGFSETASFSRAFQRWTGLSPSSFARLDH